eukprot:CAMPEP_0197179656 /NCGR_PEP_ID=MMETSP1423-20130617/4525_1 /TAXON_ID=476441 /ORGANISM="Pseudo-nitzschia heimii, Strain UNC1101" /LENGTH=556 /DNA_ID=CAMNT_0042629591 /DNA_START=402 /DNA_END=2075 /DNA_ORIENTATION=-
MNRGRRPNTGLIEQENEAYSRSTMSSSSNPVVSAFEARRRRKNKGGDGNGFPSSSDCDPAEDDNGSGRVTRKGSRISRRFGPSKNSDAGSGKGGKDLPKKEADPYDSDPGESYREHCERIEEQQSRSCLVLPRFLNGGKFLGRSSPQIGNSSSSSSAAAGGAASSSLGVKILDKSGGPQRIQDDTSGATSPPSPLLSEPDLNDGRTPASLPHDLARVRYSLRTSIGDGTDVQPGGGSAALMERRELRPNNVHINVSHWSDFGGRNYMEDRYAIEDMGAVQVEVSPIPMKNQKNEAGVEVTFGQRKNRRLKMPLTWLGVYDGHGGAKASQFCSDWMSSYVRNEESYPFDLGYAMKSAFTSIDEDFVATGLPDGSTACAATLVGGRRIVCANAGDSRAIVVRRDGTVVRLSRDHKPGMPDETRRISELGGRVIYWGRWRVEGLLAVSRSVGDASLKPYVTAEPEVCEYDIGKDDWFMVISSDGIWDVMDNEEAAHVVIASSCVMEDGRLKIDTNRFKWAARNLCDHAKSCGSTDNFSCIVVDLKSCGNPQAKQGRYSP